MSGQETVMQDQGDLREQDEAVATERGAGDVGTSMSAVVVGNTDRIANLETALRNERNRHAATEDRLMQEQRAAVEQLTQQLNDALARVDLLSADLAKERSMQDTQPLQLQYSPRPSNSPALSQHTDHSGQPRSRSYSPTGSHSLHLYSTSSEFSLEAGTSRGEGINSGIFDVTIQPRDPPTFSGRTQDDPEVWVGQVSNFFRLVGGPPRKQVAYASALLQGIAQTWW